MPIGEREMRCPSRYYGLNQRGRHPSMDYFNATSNYWTSNNPPPGSAGNFADQSPEPDSGGFLAWRNDTYPQAHTLAKAEYFDKNPATLETMADVV